MAHSMKRGFSDNYNSSPFKRPRGDKSYLRVLVSSRVAGSIIGRGGANIKKLRTDNNARVRVPDCPGPERVMSIEAESEDQLLTVIKQSMEMILEDAGKGKSSMSGKDSLELRLLIHQSQVGGIIGKGGSKIKEIKESSGANVKAYGNCAPQSTERVVAVIGSVEHIVQAIKEVLNVLKENETRGRDEPYDPINFDAIYAYEYGGYGAEAEMRNFNGPQGGPNYRPPFGGASRFDSSGSGPSRYDRSASGPSFEQSSGFGGPSFRGSSAIDESGPQETSQVTIPADMAGAIIGPGGNRIKQIRLDSKSGITIGEPLPESNERIITITGTPRNIQAAQYLLQQCIREFGNQSSSSGGRF